MMRTYKPPPDSGVLPLIVKKSTFVSVCLYCDSEIIKCENGLSSPYVCIVIQKSLAHTTNHITDYTELKARFYILAHTTNHITDYTELKLHFYI